MSSIVILFESGPCVVVLKPSGLLTQAPPGIDSLELRVKEFLKTREAVANDVYLGVPHRLDRPVSGPVIVARTLRATRKLSKQFERREVRKVYWACIEGRVEPEAGRWDDFLRKVPGEPRAEIVPADHPDGRAAVLKYVVRDRRPWGTWLEIELETGRMHQIRVQAARRGHPVLGDAMYGSNLPFGEQFDDWRLRAIALHGRELEFRDPLTKQTVHVVAPLPEAWRELELNQS